MTNTNMLSSQSSLLQVSDKHVKYCEFRKKWYYVIVLFHYFFQKFRPPNQTEAGIYSGHFNIH